MLGQKEHLTIFSPFITTPKKKTPFFVFHNRNYYHNFMFPSDKLTMLGTKTTCKDRWRQVRFHRNGQEKAKLVL